MPTRAPRFRPHAPRPAVAEQQAMPAHTGEGPRLYNTAEWKRLRRDQLSAEPFCKMCHDNDGRVERATVVDHIKAHRGDRALFFDPLNLQSLCKWHHDAVKQSIEKGGAGVGKKRAWGVDGLPLP